MLPVYAKNENVYPSILDIKYGNIQNWVNSYKNITYEDKNNNKRTILALTFKLKKSVHNEGSSSVSYNIPLLFWQDSWTHSV